MLREEKGGGERERNTDRLPLLRAPTGNQTHILGMHPDQDSNAQPFGLPVDAPTKRGTLARAGQFSNHNLSKSADISRTYLCSHKPFSLLLHTLYLFHSSSEK